MYGWGARAYGAPPGEGVHMIAPWLRGLYASNMQTMPVTLIQHFISPLHNQPSWVHTHLFYSSAPPPSVPHPRAHPQLAFSLLGKGAVSSSKGEHWALCFPQ